MWSITMDFVPKSKTTPMLAKVSTSRIRSNTDFSVLSPSYTILGLILKYLAFEYAGNLISKVPTFVDLKVPFEIFQFNGTYRSPFGMLHEFYFLIKIRSLSDPEAKGHFQARFGYFFFPKIKI